MIKPNYVRSFNKIADKIIKNQSAEINSGILRNSGNNALNYIYSFVLLDCIDNLQSNSSDFESMNNNLNFLQTQWIY